MCEAATLLAIGTAVSVAGAGVGAYSAIKSGEAQQHAADYQAAVDKNNATIASWNADIAERAQADKTQAIQRQTALRLGAQRAAFGAAGVGMDDGSALDVQSATEQDGGRAAVASAYQGALTGYGYRTQQQNFLSQASMSTAAGQNAASAGYMNAGATLLSSAGQVASKWYAFKGPSAPPDRTGMGVDAGMGALY